MAEQDWPVATPRDEVLARVAARGTRIRAVRGAVNALIVLSVVGASSLGLGVAVDAVTDGGDSTEVETVAPAPEAPELPEVAGPGTDDPSTPTTSGTATSDPDRITTDPPPGSSSSTPRPGATTGSSGSTTSTTGPTTSRPRTGGSPTATTTPGSTTSEPSTTTTTTTAPPTTVPPPEVSNLRMKADGVQIAQTLCTDAAESTVAAEVEGADTVVMSWKRANDQTRSREMTYERGEWVAPLGQLEDQDGRFPVMVTIHATGPGGTTNYPATIAVENCGDLLSAPRANTNP